MVDLARDLSLQVAQMVGDSDELAAIAQQVASEAAADASTHSRSGSFAGAFRVEKQPGRRGVTEPTVVNDDPEASHIELGHYAVNPHTGQTTDQWVKGLHILRNAAAKNGGYS